MNRQQAMNLIDTERDRQEARYGEANLTTPWGNGPETRWLAPFSQASATRIQSEFRMDYEDFEMDHPGEITWVHLIREELAEAIQEDDPERLRDELVQVAALVVSWLERMNL